MANTNSSSLQQLSSMVATGVKQHPAATTAASFYASLVELPPDAPRWAAQSSPAKPNTYASIDAATAHVRKPVRFRSSGVHDMSNVGKSNSASYSRPPGTAVQGQQLSDSMQPGADGAWVQSNGPGNTGFGAAHWGLGFQAPIPIPEQGEPTIAGQEAEQHQQPLHPQRDPALDGSGFETRPALGPRVSRARRLAQAEALIEAQWQSAQAAFTAKERADAAKGPALAADNVGYKLLQRAGWQQGQGLGAHAQGPVKPVQALRNPGVQGIGFSTGSVHGQRQPRDQQSRHERQHATAAASGSQPAHADPAGDEARHAARAKRARLRQAVEQELAGETLQEKVALHRAVMQAEADAAESKMLQRALRAAFNDPFDNVGAATANTNPLGHRNRLTATNPLLDSDE